MHNDLIGITIECSDRGVDKKFTVLDFLDYDSATEVFTLEVQETETEEVTIRELSDRVKYPVIGYPDKRYPNETKLSPKQVKN